MINSDQPTLPIAVTTIEKETQQQRFQQLKRTADRTGKRYIQVYLEDERKRRGSQR